MAGLSRAIALCGTEQVDPPSRVLRAGPLSVELENGALRYVRLGGSEMIRAIAFLVRDENWGTFTPKLENLEDRRAARRVFGDLPRHLRGREAAAHLRRDHRRPERRVTPLRGGRRAARPTSSPTAPASSCCTRSRASPVSR